MHSCVRYISKWGCALRVVKRRPLFDDSVVKAQISACRTCISASHFQSAKHIFKARVRARGTDIGFRYKPRYCFLFSFLSFFCFFSFFPSFSLLAMSGSFLWVVHNSPAAPAAGEIWVQKKRVVSDAPEAWFLGCSFTEFSLVFC